ncbi:MAG: diaminopimelate epimerase [Oscillospiraceae bacterium]
MKIRFSKICGCSGDYIFVDNSKAIIKDISSLARKICQYHSGVGGEALVLINTDKSADADAELTVYGADGSKQAMFDNCALGAAEYLFCQKKILGDMARIKCGELVKNIKRLKKGILAVDVGTPEFAPEKIPLPIYKKPLINTLIEVGGGAVRVNVLKLGNTHCVVIKDNLDFLDLPFSGPAFEHCSIFPSGVNTEFIQVIDKTHLRMRAWEYERGESFGCAASAGAALAAAIANKYCEMDTQVEIILRSGSVKLMWTQGSILLTGDAHEVFSGSYNM